MSEGLNNRIAYFDHIRIAAAFLVMFLHVSSLNWWWMDVNGGAWKICTAFSSFAACGVLLFVMISGALFLGRDISIKTIYTKYILRLLIAYVFWSVLYAVVFNLKNGFGAIVKAVLSSHYHLWFLPMLIGLYICIPIFRLIVSSEKTTKYFLVVSFVFAFLIPQVLNMASDFCGSRIRDIAAQISSRISDMHLDMVLGYSFFFVAGYFFNKKEMKRRVCLAACALGFIGFISAAVLTAADSHIRQTPYNTYMGYFTVGEMLLTIGIFLLFKGIVRNGHKSGKFVLLLSEYSFGAYLIHPMLLELLDDRFGLKAYISRMPLIYAPLLAIGIFVISFAVSAILNLIPGIKKYIV